MATRNDDHGGNPLRRLQAFVDCFDEQCGRTGLDAELIVVEWNPPAERPRVSALLRLPVPKACCYRFIDVPAEIHQRLRHADVLPMFQMIAKNVGVRRARGRFVLATNIDVLLSTELVEGIAARTLDRMRLYRADRHDIETHIPMDVPLDQRMQFCASHHLRVHRRQGSYAVAPDGQPKRSSEDIVDGRTVRLGSGWHVVESAGEGRSFRWADHTAELIVGPEYADRSTSAVLEIELESNPHERGSWVALMALENWRLLAKARNDGAGRLIVPIRGLEVGVEHRVRLEVLDASPGESHCLPIFERRRKLAYRVFSARLRPGPESAPDELSEYPIEGWANANVGSSVRCTRTPDGLLITSDPRSASYCIRYGPLQVATSGAYRFEIAATLVEGDFSAGVLSAAGRFWIPSHVTVHRHASGEWITLEGGLLARHPFWLVIYNNHPDGNLASTFEIHRLDGPGKMLDDKGKPVVSRVARRLLSNALAERAAVLSAKAALRARNRAGDTLGRRPTVRSTVTHILVQWLTQILGPAIRREVTFASPEFQRLQAALDAALTRAESQPPPSELTDFATFLSEMRPEDLHVNGCGDFQLMAREQWELLRGYPEFETFSMNIDAVLSYMASAAGLKEQVVESPIYHLEHEIGSGWSPEGEALLRQRIAERGITWVDAKTVHIWAAYMRWLGRPIIFNGPDWGLNTMSLPETVVGQGR